MTSIINELWHGNIIPQEDSRTNSKKMKELLRSLEEETPGLFGNVFHSIEHVNLQTILGYQERTDTPVIRVTDGDACPADDEI